MKTCQVNPTSATYGPRLFVVKELTSMRAGALPSCAMDLGGLCEEFQGGVGSSTSLKGVFIPTFWQFTDFLVTFGNIVQTFVGIEADQTKITAC